jgi:outer membrane protein TolC
MLPESEAQLTSSSSEAMKLQPFHFQPIFSLAFAAGLFLAPQASKAGVLLDIYAEAVEAAPVKKGGDLRSQAAKQNVITNQRSFLPRIAVDARELWVNQNLSLRDDGFGDRSNSSDYANTRANVELDQPLYDPTIKPKIEASKAHERLVNSQSQFIVELKTRRVVDQFLGAARLQKLIEATDRVIVRLENELKDVEKRKDTNVATISEVQNIRLALAAMKRDRSNYNLNRNYALVNMGPGGKSLANSQLQWDQSKSPAEWSLDEEGEKNSAELKGLQAEADEFTHQASAVKRRSWPVFSLVAHYGLDNGGNPEFGGIRNGNRDLNYFEGGIAVRWNIFDRGMNNSEAKEYELKQQAKQAELQEKVEERAQIAANSKELLKYSKRSVNELTRLVDEYKVLMDSSARAYKAGQGSYVDSITAYIAYESAMRDWIDAQYALLNHQIAHFAEASGWNKELVEKVDGMFTLVK